MGKAKQRGLGGFPHERLFQEETGKTNYIERFNCTLRQKISRLVRKTLFFSKKFDYRDWVLGVDPHNLIFIDESGINLGMTRSRGRAIRGERLHAGCPRNRGSNISVLGALSIDGWRCDNEFARKCQHRCF